MPKRVNFNHSSNPDAPESRVKARMQLWSSITNGVLIASAITVILATSVVYIHQPWLKLTNAMHSIISANVTLGLLLALSTISVLLGSVGLYTICNRSTLILGLQIFALILLAMLEVGVLYGFLSHWLANLTVGVTYAVQTFRPGSPGQVDIAAIQTGLHCCGRESYKDYYIANEEIPFGYVPFSCCNTRLHWHRSLSECITDHAQGSDWKSAQLRYGPRPVGRAKTYGI
ncbi:hypothetical protein FGIG_03544 [Fasciola gigantica]|uniref:Tetraspanin n=1 Tax=Fasciola gigantica TaxID=46835 RepID=A0A504Z003_FASGI|nr:hypothetical protein FGIG_03544 [Fasciola gigantica]